MEKLIENRKFNYVTLTTAFMVSILMLVYGLGLTGGHGAGLISISFKTIWRYWMGFALAGLFPVLSPDNAKTRKWLTLSLVILMIALLVIAWLPFCLRQLLFIGFRIPILIGMMNAKSADDASMSPRSVLLWGIAAFVLVLIVFAAFWSTSFRILDPDETSRALLHVCRYVIFLPLTAGVGLLFNLLSRDSVVAFLSKKNIATMMAVIAASVCVALLALHIYRYLSTEWYKYMLPLGCNPLVWYVAVLLYRAVSKRMFRPNKTSGI